MLSDRLRKLTYYYCNNILTISTRQTIGKIERVQTIQKQTREKQAIRKKERKKRKKRNSSQQFITMAVNLSAIKASISGVKRIEPSLSLVANRIRFRRSCAHVAAYRIRRGCASGTGTAIYTYTHIHTHIRTYTYVYT